MNIEELKKEREKFIFSVIGIKIVDYSGKQSTFEFPEPMKNKDGVVSLFNPITLLILKKNLVKALNEKLEKKIKGMPQIKIKIVGTGEEKWI